MAALLLKKHRLLFIPLCILIYTISSELIFIDSDTAGRNETLGYYTCIARSADSPSIVIKTKYKNDYTALFSGDELPVLSESAGRVIFEKSFRHTAYNSMAFPSRGPPAVIESVHWGSVFPLPGSGKRT
jgi:hypothetical protein